MLETIIRKDASKEWIWPKGDRILWDSCQAAWPQIKNKYLKYTKKQDLIVQAGGAAGYYPFHLASIFGTVLTFEPDLLNFHCLDQNCQAENIIKANAALGSTMRQVGIRRDCLENAGENRITEKGDISMLKIDDLPLSACDCIHLDTEGYEYDALVGAAETLKRFAPTLILEGTNAKIREFVREFGYVERETVDIDTIYTPSLLDADGRLLKW